MIAATPTRKPLQFRLSTLFLLITIVALLFALPAAQERREQARRAQATRELKQLGLQKIQAPANRRPN